MKNQSPKISPVFKKINDFHEGNKFTSALIEAASLVTVIGVVVTTANLAGMVVKKKTNSEFAAFVVKGTVLFTALNYSTKEIIVDKENPSLFHKILMSTGLTKVPKELQDIKVKEAA